MNSVDGLLIAKSILYINGNVSRRDDEENEEDFFFDEENQSGIVDAAAENELNALIDSLMKLEDSDEMTIEDLQEFYDNDCAGDNIVSKLLGSDQTLNIFQ